MRDDLGCVFKQGDLAKTPWKKGTRPKTKWLGVNANPYQLCMGWDGMGCKADARTFCITFFHPGS